MSDAFTSPTCGASASLWPTDPPSIVREANPGLRVERVVFRDRCPSRRTTRRRALRLASAAGQQRRGACERPW